MQHATEACPRKAIVIVEDDRTTAKILEIQLVRLGYHIPRVFASPREAIREIGRYRPDLVIIGISFPGDLDGIEAASILHGIFDIPIVFLTASSEQDTIARAMQVRPSGYIVKPPDQTKLQGALSTAFSAVADQDDFPADKSPEAVNTV